MRRRDECNDASLDAREWEPQNAPRRPQPPSPPPLPAFSTVSAISTLSPLSSISTLSSAFYTMPAGNSASATLRRR